MKNKTKNKKKYIEAWCGHLESLYLLAFTPTEELSKEVTQTLDHLKELVVRIANDKGLK